jgi:hypothetical protein
LLGLILANVLAAISRYSLSMLPMASNSLPTFWGQCYDFQNCLMFINF